MAKSNMVVTVKLQGLGEFQDAIAGLQVALTLATEMDPGRCTTERWYELGRTVIERLRALGWVPKQLEEE